MSRFVGVALWPFAALTVFAASGALPGLTRVDAAQEAPLQSDWVRANLMKAHYRAVLALQDSVIRGDRKSVV